MEVFSNQNRCAISLGLLRQFLDRRLQRVVGARYSSCGRSETKSRQAPRSVPTHYSELFPGTTCGSYEVVEPDLRSLDQAALEDLKAGKELGRQFRVSERHAVCKRRRLASGAGGQVDGQRQPNLVSLKETCPVPGEGRESC